MEREKKLVKKYLPVQPFDMAGLEEWLSDMAAQGLFLEKIGWETARFRRDVPKAGVRYALDVAGPYGIDGERNENYAQMGWDYVTTLALSMASFMYYVYRSDDPQAPALHTDPVTQGSTLTLLLRRGRWMLFWTLVVLAVLFRHELVTLFTTPWAIPRFVILKTENALLWLVLIVPYLVLRFIPLARQRWALVKLRRQLLDGIPLDRGRRWPRKFPPGLLDWGLIALMAAVMVVYSMLTPTLTRELSGPEDWTFPHVTLEQVMDGAAFTPESSEDKMLHPDTFRSSLLCPEQYSWNQGGEADSQGVRDLWLSGRYYRARSERAAQILLSCLVKDQEKAWRDWQKRQDEFVNTSQLTALTPFHPIAPGGLDELWMEESQIDDDPVTRIYLGRKGEQVFQLVCRGIPDPEECLAEMCQQLV